MSHHSWGEFLGTPREPHLTTSAGAAVTKTDSLVSQVNALAFPQPLLYAALGGYASNTGVPVTPLTALQAAAVYGCVKCISDDIAGLDIIVRKRLANGNGWKIDTDHPLNELFANPNRWQTPFEFWSYIVSSLCFRGNSFAVIERDMDGRPVELVPIAPDRVTVRLTDDGTLWYRCNSRHIGYGIMVPPDDMLHLKNISLDSYLGVSPIAIAQDVIGLALATQQHGAVLFRQGGQIGGTINHPGKLSKEAGDRMAASWKDTHSGVQNAHKVAILEEGAKFEKVGMTNEDAQFLATRQFQTLEICRLFKVPPHKIGELTRATFSNIEQQQQQYIDDALQPIAKRIRDAAHAQLLFDDERDTYQVSHSFESMLRGDQKTRFESYQIGLLNGFLSRNEVRQRENMNPVEGGDEYRVPLNTADPTKPGNIPQQIPGGGNGDGDGNGDDGDGSKDDD
jgi:HK97 family phage portal protein